MTRLSDRRPAWIRIRWCLVLATASLTGCQGLTDPPLPKGAVRFTPPEVYTRWWAMTEACSGLSGRLDGVAWYVVPNSSGFEQRGGWVTGYWSAGSNQIVLAASTQYEGSAVRHEMLHALVRRAGHSAEMFRQRCGGVVQCNACITSDEPAPPEYPRFVAVTSESLDVTIDLAPIDPSGPDGDGFVTLTVKARNVASYPVSVELSPRSLPTFFYELKGGVENRSGRPSGTRHPDATRFLPGETKQHVFDFRILDDGYGAGLSPGEYAVVGGYGRNHHGATLVVR